MQSGGEEEEEQSAAGTSQNVGRIEGAVQTALIHQAPSQGVSRTRPQVGGNCASIALVGLNIRFQSINHGQLIFLPFKQNQYLKINLCIKWPPILAVPQHSRHAL